MKDSSENNMKAIELQLFLNEKLCDIADILLSYYNCCDIKGSSCKAGDPNPCCSGRTHYGDGCPFWKEECRLRSSDCKLWICRTAIKTTDPKCVEALLLLEKFAVLFELGRTKPLIGDGYVGADRPKKK